MNAPAEVATERVGFVVLSYGTYLARSAKHYGAQGGHARVWSESIDDALIVGADMEAFYQFIDNEFSAHERQLCDLKAVRVGGGE